MLEAQNEMKVALENADIKSPTIPVVANVTANLVSDPRDIRALLTQQITGSVRWRETMLFMASQGVEDVIEIGSGKVLAGLVGRTCPGVNAKSIQNAEDLKLLLS